MASGRPGDFSHSNRCLSIHGNIATFTFILNMHFGFWLHASSTMWSSTKPGTEFDAQWWPLLVRGKDIYGMCALLEEPAGDGWENMH